MHTELAHGSLHLRFGRQFGVPEARRLSETIRSFGPLRKVTLDFTDVRDFEDCACDLLAATLRANQALNFVLRGLTLHQSRVLGYFGVR